MDYNHENVGEILEADTILDDFYGGEQNRRKSPRSFVLEQIKLLNADQLAAFNRIKSAVLDNNPQKLFFLEGSGGCGKNECFFCRLFRFFKVKRSYIICLYDGVLLGVLMMTSRLILN